MNSSDVFLDEYKFLSGIMEMLKSYDEVIVATVSLCSQIVFGILLRDCWQDFSASNKYRYTSAEGKHITFVSADGVHIWRGYRCPIVMYDPRGLVKRETYEMLRLYNQRFILTRNSH